MARVGKWPTPGGDCVRPPAECTRPQGCTARGGGAAPSGRVAVAPPADGTTLHRAEAASRGAWHLRVGRPARACVLCCCALRAHGNAAQLQVRRAQAAVREDGSARYAVRRQCLAVEGAACCASCRVVLHLQYVSVVCAGVQRCVGLSAGRVRGELQLAPRTRLQLPTFDLSRIILTSLRPEAVSPLSLSVRMSLEQLQDCWRSSKRMQPTMSLSLA